MKRTAVTDSAFTATLPLGTAAIAEDLVKMGAERAPTVGLEC
jgi:hypothetical protein